MAQRSPNYPTLGLSEAISTLKTFYDEAKRTTVDSVSAARALGYSSLSGLARSKLSVLKKYGFLEEIEEGKFRVSDLGLRIVVPASDADKLAALRAAALTPALFREIHASHKDASSAILVSFLVREKAFTEDGAKAFDAAYRDTVKVAKLDDSAYIPPSGVPVPEETPPMHTQLNPPPPPPSGTGRTVAVNEGTLALSVPYRGTSLSVTVQVAGQLTRDHVAKVRKYLELAEEDLDEPKQEE